MQAIKITFPDFLRAGCGHIIKFGRGDIKGRTMYYFFKVTLKEGGKRFFLLPLLFLFHHGWSIDRMAGTQAAIVDYELEAT